MLGHGVVQRQAALICVSMKLYSGFSRGSLRLKRGQMLLVILIVLSFFVHCLAWSYGYGSQRYKTIEPQTGPAKTKFMTNVTVFLVIFGPVNFNSAVAVGGQVSGKQVNQRSRPNRLEMFPSKI